MEFGLIMDHHEEHSEEELKDNADEGINLEEAGNEDLTTKKKKSRQTKGIVRLEKIIADKIKEIKINLRFNKRGQSIGTPERALQCYLGMQAKSMVSITYDNWHDVPAATLENIWKDLAFHLNEGMRKEVMSSVGIKWRAFKTFLTRRFVAPYLNNQDLLEANPTALDVPPKRYNIPEEEWKNFVTKRKSKEFQEFSKKQKERRAALEYPHRSSRHSYKEIEIDLQTKLGTDEPIDRSILWKEARKDASGNYVNERDKLIGDATDDLLDKRNEGTLVEVGTNDILTQVLGTNEHPGRVRGQSCGVTQRDYFLKPAGGFSGLQQYQFQFQQHQSQKYLDDFKKLEQSFEQRLRSQAEQFEVERKREREEREQERELFLTKFTELANKISSLKGSEVSLPTIVSRTSETPTPMEVVNESLVSSKDNQKSRLLTENGDTVAIGQIMATSGKIHCVDLRKGNYRVQVDECCNDELNLFFLLEMRFL
ncbi:uncharacterized protein LOC133814644 [Humulus lupulus]|uniref:uncharacterized protein LOC133814644 n=1 Tax=Humulus lupulus TaxID=3486 RepID=UPI002B407C5C|nr:uncharacterized protein LOC133814644 [Humulus lupulus]